jgi:hypothetical protein
MGRLRVATVRPRPSTRGYWAGGALVVVATLVAVAWLASGFLGFMDRVDGFHRVAVPGTTTLELAAGATEVVFVEAPRGLPVDAHVAVSGPAGAVTLSPYPRDLRYDVPGHSDLVGGALAQFRADRSGRYTVRAGGAAPAGTVVAIGDHVDFDAGSNLVTALAVFVVGAGLGGAVMARTARRARS